MIRPRCLFELAAAFLTVAVGHCAVIPFACAVEFRTHDGTENNPLNSAQGAANTRVIRFKYDADYPDGIGDQITGLNKPNPRAVSNRVHAQTASIPNARGLSDWVVHWGQFLTHDMSLIRTGDAYNMLSTGEIGDFNIPITEPNDPLGPGPIPFARSNFDPATGNGDVEQTPRGPIPVPRWQINSNSSYLDASQVYGSDVDIAKSLRTMVDGKLITSGDGSLPMTDAAGRFVAGDERVNENLGLTAIHTLFVREHNRLADRIKSYDPSLSDEAIYQWARKIVGAQVQSITYREFLPALMGDVAPAADDYQYDPGVDATITTAFSTAAFRFGHSMQSPQLLLLDDAAGKSSLTLHEASEKPSYFVNDPASVDWLLNGLAHQVAQENDVYVVDELRNIPFGPPGAGGTDLAAADIQRGRDHGLLNSYNRLRTSYDLAPLDSFAQLTSDVAVQAALADAYGTLDNLDAWVAVIAEDHFPGTSMGALGLTILYSQFERLRDGDRFFFTGDADLQGPLVSSVIDLQSVTLSQIIRWNTTLDAVPQNVFLATAVTPEPGTWFLLLSVAPWLVHQRPQRTWHVDHQREAAFVQAGGS